MNMFMEVMQGGGQACEAAPRRRRIWEIDVIFRCPVVGMCLSIPEQRRLCRKVGAAEHSKTDFGVHEMVVATMDGENPLSRKLESLLTRKFESACREYLEISEEDFLLAWRKGIADGEYQGLLWAAAVRGLSRAATVEVFGSLHMAMHEHAKAYGSLAAARGQTEGRLALERERNRDMQKAIRRLASENAALNMSLAKIRGDLERAREERIRHGRGGAGTDQRADSGGDDSGRAGVELERQLLEVECARRGTELAELREKLGRMEGLHARLREEYDAHLAMDAAMRKACAGESCRGGSCTPTCPSYDLCEKRVLIVGGIERMEKAYRKFVEDRGGIFEYHAGKMKSGRKDLENSVQRADVVLCPVNCNSHGACLVVKNLGKKYNKPVQMLRNFSLSAVARAVDGLAETN